MSEAKPQPLPAISESAIRDKLIGNQHVFDVIFPYLNAHKVGLARTNQPQGVFLLTGPTGVGKTYTVELIAELLHRSKCLLRIDCGEYTLEHETAKLLGAPPGYVGHEKTPPRLTQARINSVASEFSPISVVLFDEIEKAPFTLQETLLSLCDTAVLHLGDNTRVDFSKSLIFFTSNTGGKDLINQARGGFNFARPQTSNNSIGYTTLTKKFLPEFLNRVDEVISYELLTTPQMKEIRDMQLYNLQIYLDARLGKKSPKIQLTHEVEELILPLNKDRIQFGARVIKRAIYRHIVLPLSEYLLTNQTGILEFSLDANLKVQIERID